MKYAFLLYDSRSGSTLLSSLLSQAVDLGVTVENFFVTHLLESPHRPLDAHRVQDFIGDLYRDPVFADLGLDEQALRLALGQVQEPASDVAMIDAFFDHCFESLGLDDGEVRVVKNAVYGHMSTLRTLLPDVKFIHVIRDGRDVFSSKRSNTGVEGRSMGRSVVKAATDWCRKIDMADGSGADELVVQYEQLVATPTDVLIQVTDFLGVSAQQDAAGVERFVSSIGKRQSHLHTRVGGEVSSASVARWKNELSGWEVRVFDAIAGKHLRRFGYETGDSASLLDWTRGIAGYTAVRVSNGLYSIRRGRVQRRLASHLAIWRERRTSAMTTEL